MVRAAEFMRNVFRGDGERWVLEECGAPIGFIDLIENEIAGLFLHPSFHGKGLGRALVDHAVSLKGPLRVEVFEDNTLGRRFYELRLRFRGTLPARRFRSMDREDGNALAGRRRPLQLSAVVCGRDRTANRITLGSER